MRLLCTVTCTYGKRYKAGVEYNLAKNPNPARFTEVTGGVVEAKSQALSETVDLILTDEERNLVLAHRRGDVKLDDLKFTALKELAIEKGLETDGARSKEDMLKLLKD